MFMVYLEILQQMKPHDQQRIYPPMTEEHWKGYLCF
jgi:hypothetical protein